MLRHGIWWYVGEILDVAFRSLSSWSKDVTCYIIGYGGMGYGGSQKGSLLGHWLFAVQRSLWMKTLREKKRLSRTCTCDFFSFKTHIFYTLKTDLAQIPVRHHVPFRVALPIPNAQLIVNEGPENPRTDVYGCLFMDVYDHPSRRK